jgi:hypothetical protein
MIRLSATVLLSSVTLSVAAQTTFIDAWVGGPVSTMNAATEHPPFTYTQDAINWNSDPRNTRYFPDVYTHSVMKSGTTPLGSVVLTDLPGTTKKVFQVIANRPSAPVEVRSEVATLWEYSKDKPRWYGMSVYIPTDFYQLDTEQVIMQIHNQGFPPTLSVQVKKTEMSVVLKSTQKIGGPLQAQLISLGQLQKGKWYCLVAHVGWSPEIGVGSMELYWNGKNVYNATNLSNTYPDQGNGNYPKVGVYIPGNANLLPAGFSQQRVFTDFIYVSDDPAMNAYDMKAKTPCGQG